MKKGLFIASTGQDVGKTTVCLGLFSGLCKQFPHIGYMKPVGQEQLLTKEGVFVDKDVLLFKEHFALEDASSDMSPLLVPPGFTRAFLDEKIDRESLAQKIHAGWQRVQQAHDFLLVEGTGHCGVGTIFHLNNAEVAKMLGLPILLLASGGLGSSFDALALNKCVCDSMGVKILGVILNRVLPEKKEMVHHYMSKALKRWDIPLLGCIPFDPRLSHLCMKDLEALFKTTLTTGKTHRLRHFSEVHFVATSVEAYRDTIVPRQLLITPALREDIIFATLQKHWEHKQAFPQGDLHLGLILTGDFPPRHYVIEEIEKADIPMFYTSLHSDSVIQKIYSFTAKIRTEDIEKIEEAIEIVEQHVNFKLLK